VIKKHFLLFFASLFAIGLMVGILSKSENRLETDHNKVLNILRQLRIAETELDQSLLKQRSQLAQNYDGLVEAESSLSMTCRNLKDFDFLNHKAAKSLKSSLNDFCILVQEKLELVEDFKSKYAVVQNSMRYISFVESENSDNSHKSSGAHHQNLKSYLIYSTYSYYVAPNENGRERLLNVQNDLADHIKKITQTETRTEMNFLLSHSQAILTNTSQINNLIKDIVESETDKKINEITAVYLKDYESSVSESRLYKYLLFASCILLILFAITKVNRIWQMAANLEKRVEERTHELEQSLKVISNQQQALSQSAKMSALGEMAGGVAHEINNPLAIITLNADLLMYSINQENSTPKKLLDGLNTILQTVDRISKIVRGLRTFSRDGSHDPMQNFLLKDLLSDTISLCQEKLKQHDINLKINTPDKELQLNGRAVQISQVLLNLINNARDAVINLPEKWIQIDCRKLDNSIEIVVTDSGNGIPKEVYEKIFQPFFTTKEIGKGTGLGLSVSSGIITAHKGELFYDEKNAHTSFVIRLPHDEVLVSEPDLRDAA
jgi:C4-dicarboxylate-specific signal transduction histidine kinase